MTNTSDLSKFGNRELAVAGQLLTAYTENPILGDGIHIEFNPSSGYVFIVDSDFRTAMMKEDKLEEWFYCGECGHEGFLEDFKDAKVCKCKDCKRISKGEEA